MEKIHDANIRGSEPFVAYQLLGGADNACLHVGTMLGIGPSGHTHRRGSCPNLTVGNVRFIGTAGLGATWTILRSGLFIQFCYCPFSMELFSHWGMRRGAQEVQ